MSFREQQKKKLVAFEAQETDNDIQDEKSRAQKTDGYVKLRWRRNGPRYRRLGAYSTTRPP